MSINCEVVYDYLIEKPWFSSNIEQVRRMTQFDLMKYLNPPAHRNLEQIFIIKLNNISRFIITQSTCHKKLALAKLLKDRSIHFEANLNEKQRKRKNFTDAINSPFYLTYQEINVWFSFSTYTFVFWHFTTRVSRAGRKVYPDEFIHVWKYSHRERERSIKLISFQTDLFVQ